ASARPLSAGYSHGSVDWLWEYPALSGLALAPLGAMLALDRSAATRRPQRGIAPRAAAVATGLVALLVAVAAATAFVSERLQERGLHRSPTDPAGAYADLNRAATLEPLSSQPDLTA